jgi:hypothetical protein
MKILAANLKHLYQRRILWLFYVYLGLIILIIFSSVAAEIENPDAGRRHFIWLLMHEFLIGCIAAALQIEVLNKPLSYCLPGHRKTIRKFIFWVGIVISFVGSLLFFAYPGLLSWETILILCSAFCANLIFYWFGVGFVFVNKNAAIAIALFFWWAIFVPMLLDLHIMIESIFVQYFAIIVFIGGLSSIAAWFWLGNEGLARRYCAVPWISLFDLWNRDKLLRYSQSKAVTKWNKLKTHPNPQVEGFFLARMQIYGHFGIGRYIWGSLYTTFGIAISQGKGNLLGLFILLLMAIFFSYMGPMAAIIFYFLPAFMVGQIRLPVYSSMLISGGRKERFLTAMTLVATIAVLITALVTTIAALSVPLATTMPDITLHGKTFTFHAMSLQPFFVPLLMIPIVFTIQLFFFKKPYFVTVTIILLFMLLFTGGSLLKALSTVINPIYLIVSLLILSWSIFVMVLRYICMKRCLVGQGHAY